MFTAREASVVLASPSPIDPQTIRPEVLRNAGVAPPDWEFSTNLATPVIAQIQYKNVTVQTEGNRCIFKETIQGDLPTSYEVHSLATRYLGATPLVPYNAMGINWTLEVSAPDAVVWLRRNVVAETRLQGFSPVSAQLVQQFEPALCNLTFKLQPHRVIVDCNYHFELGDDAPKHAIDHLTGWDRYQSHITNVMGQIGASS